MDTYWSIVDAIYNTSFSFFFFILTFLMFYIGLKGWRANNRYGGISSTICGVCFMIFGIYNLVFRFFPYPYNGFMIWWICFNLVMNFIFTLIIKRDIKKMRQEQQSFVVNEGNARKTSILRRYILRMTKEDPYSDEITLKMEVIRKSFHLTGFLILIAYYGLFIIPPVTQIISDSVIVLINQVEPSYTLLWGPISLFPYKIGSSDAITDLTMMALIGSLVFAIISDLIRILWGPEYSIFNFLTKSMLRNKERNAAGPQIYIMTGFIFSFMLVMKEFIHISAFFAGILIACLSDAAAALIGRHFGKHKVQVRSRDIKSVEGFIAGIVVAYIIGLFFVGPIYAIIGAVIFFITDYFPVFTADNILNPIFIPIGIQVFISILGLPVGFY
jgi:dolichol kinase